MPGCFVDGFEVGMLRWFSEAADLESYKIGIDSRVERSGSRWSTAIYMYIDIYLSLYINISIYLYLSISIYLYIYI